MKSITRAMPGDCLPFIIDAEQNIMLKTVVEMNEVESINAANETKNINNGTTPCPPHIPAGAAAAFEAVFPATVTHTPA